ncbi:hypothetical protein Taro_046512 [Colocasia esculenta]|uniref:Uncharacterized protein n=1 Tax=Colocasia esculenta TaxID=4460 RepID=A0A843WZC3_COLES|nr:hypothetical protein [Colocasia esculenta]
MPLLRAEAEEKRHVPAPPLLIGDYEKLEIYAFEMEAEIASLEEKLMASVGEREEALTRNGILETELEALSNQLNTTNSELKLMGDEITSLTLRLDESESLSRSLKANHDFILREKEEMEMQLTDALLEFETKKSTWLTAEKVLLDTDEKCKSKIARLSEDLVKVKSEMESCQNLCKNLQKNLSSSEENAKAERKCSMARSLEIAQLKNGFEMLEITRLICEVELLTARKTAEELSEKLINMEVKAQNPIVCYDLTCDLAKESMNKEMLSNNIEKTKLRMKLRSTQAKLDAFRGRYMEAVDEMELMNKKFEAASTKLKERLASYGIEILNLKKQLSTKD